MDWKKLREKLTPHALILVIFVLLSVVMFWPILKGKTLPQNDVKQWKGSFEETRAYNDTAKTRTLWTNSMFGGQPTYQIAPYSPNSLFGLKVLYGILVSGYTLPMPLNAMLLYMIGFYLLLIAFRINPWLSMVGAIAYALGSFNIVILEAGHMLQAYALGTAPMVLAALIFTFRERKYFFGASLLGVALAIHLRTNHPQISYYTGMIVFIFLIVELINSIMKKEWIHFLKASLFLGVAAAFAVGTQATFMLTNAEYATDTIRGASELTSKSNETKSTGLDKDYALSWSYGIGESMSLLIPNARGGASGAIGDKLKGPDDLSSIPAEMRQDVGGFDSYWGDQPFTSGPVYFGAIIIFLFALGLLFLETHDRWWIFAAAILSIMLAWGRNFLPLTDIFFNHVPLYNKFRSVSFLLVIAGMVMPLLAILTLDKLLKKPINWRETKSRNKFIVAFAATGGLCLILWVVPSFAGSFSKPQQEMNINGVKRMVTGDEKMVRESLAQQGKSEADIEQMVQQGVKPVLNGVADARIILFKQDAIRSFLFILLAAVVLVFYFMKKIKPEFVIIGIGLLIFIDLFSLDKRFVNDGVFVDKNESSGDILPSDADNYILADKSLDYRVANITRQDLFGDAVTSYFHKSIGGYSGTKFRRYQDLWSNAMGNQVAGIAQNLQKIRGDELMGLANNANAMSLINMMNTKYFIAGESRNQVVTNPYALGNAWFVSELKEVANADSDLNAMKTLNTRTSATWDVRFKDYIGSFKPNYDSSATIKLISYRPNELQYKANSNSEAFAVFSEIYYDNGKGWNAYLDGKKVDHIRVNYILRGMKVPAGNHTIVFRFEPQSFVTGEMLALIFSLLLIAMLAASIFMEVKKSKDEKPVKKAA